MINCSNVENFFSELKRMCKSTRCEDCGISIRNNSKSINCGKYYEIFPKDAAAVIQAWSDAHMPKTFLSDFLEKHPKAQLRENDIPVICAKYLGYTEKVDCSSDYQCVACWNAPLTEGNE